MLPSCCVVRPLPFMSATVLMLESASATIWKYCGYRMPRLHTLVVGLRNGSLPVRLSTVEIELAKAMANRPASTPTTFDTPAPGSR